MSTIKKHLTSDLNHTLPTYKKLPPISSPTPTKGSSSLIKPVTVSKYGNQPAGTAFEIDGTVVQGKKIIITKTAEAKKVVNTSGGSASQRDSKLVLKSTDPIPVESSSGGKNVELIGYKTTSSEVGRSSGNGWTPLGSELPPCKICGEKASGLHYGVYTCEACKAFFRRTLKRTNVDFQCTCSEEERLKGVDQPRKTTCPKCRYDRCIRVGMSKDAIKIGRYTINRKRQNDREVSMLKEKGKLGQTSSSNENSPASGTSYSPYSSGQSVSSPEELSTNITTLSLDETNKEVLAPKRMRGNDYKGDGILFQSLTNSIVMSLIENNQTASGHDIQPPSNTKIPSDTSEISPLEQLYMQPFKAPEGLTKTEEVLPSGIKFTPTQDQFSMLQKGGNSNPFSVPPKGGNPDQAREVVQNMQGLSVPEISPTFQFSLEQACISDSLSNSGSLAAVANQEGFGTVKTSNQNAAINNTITLSVVNQGGKLVAQQVLDSENSPIETLLQQPLELSPLSESYSPGNTVQEMKEADGLNYDHDAIVPTVTDTTLPSPLTEETGYDLDTINLPMEDLQRGVILTTKSHDSILDGLDKGIDILGESEELHEGEGLHESMFDLDHQLEQFDLYQEPVLSPGKDISMEEINNIIAGLESKALELELGVRRMTCEDIKNRHAAYLEQYRLKMEVFGKMSNISHEEYITFYNQTGIDIDNRQQIIIEVLKYLEDSITKLVKFAKVIPGFSDLDMDDQVILIKSSRFAQDMVKEGGGGSCMKCPGGEVTTTPWNKDYHIEELEKVFPKEFLATKGAYGMKVYKLDLSLEELAICRAIVITDPDQCTLKDRKSVERIYHKMIACLCHLLAVRPTGKKPLCLAEAMELLIEVRDLGLMGHQVIQEMFEMWPVSNNHTLLKDFLY